MTTTNKEKVLLKTADSEAELLLAAADVFEVAAEHFEVIGDAKAGEKLKELAILNKNIAETVKYLLKRMRGSE